MGNLCDCLNQQQTTGPTPKTPLLSGSQPGPVTVQPARTVDGRSARQHRPPEKEEFLTSLQVLTTIRLASISTLPSLDKTFQDHAKLYNDLHASFIQLREGLHDFKAMFEKDTAGIPILSECLKLLNERCGGATLTGSRTKNCIQISYDRREVSSKCQGPAEDVLETLELYNKVNHLIKSVLEKAPKVKNSVSLILEQEANLKREVTKADPDGEKGPEPVRNTAENFATLHKLQDYIDTIQKYTTKTFKEITDGSRTLFEEKT